MYSFSQRLVSIRKNNGMTQRATATSIGMTERSYQSLEYGTTKPSHDTIVKLCDFFDVSADYILGLSDDPERK